MKKTAICAVLALAVMCTGCGGPGPALPTVDPYEGMVQVESGMGTKMWVELIEELEVSPFTKDNFTIGRGYTGSGYECTRGIDVSEHQGDIDWWSVSEKSAVDYAIIRAGYRGYSEGGLYQDAYFVQNMDGAITTDMDIGIYFFSQALNEVEAREEARYLIELLEPYQPFVTLPVFFDWETIAVEAARTDGMDLGTLTDCARAFCEEIKAAGYTPGIYAYRSLAYFEYDLLALDEYPLWISAPGDWPDFYYEHDFWQYSTTGNIPGIEGGVDMNFRFEKTADQAAGTAAGSGAAAGPEAGSEDTVSVEINDA